MERDVRLAVDLGTTHTVAAVRRGDQPPRPLLFDGSPLLSSAVFVDAAGTIHTGQDAYRLATTDPHSFEPHPKQRVDDGQVLLGVNEVPVPRLLAAVLARVADEARLAGVDPTGATVLTCPAGWGKPRRDVLRAAADLAGLGPVRLLDEPIAAATYGTDILGQQIPVGRLLAVVDLGAGTLDLAVLQRGPDGLRVLATSGRDDLGGLDIDAAVVAALGERIESQDRALWQRLNSPHTPAARRDRQILWSEARAAKEMLSRATNAPIHVPGWNTTHLTRAELEQLAGPFVDQVVAATTQILTRAGVPPRQLTTLLLVGGASRMPLVASRLHAGLRLPPLVPEQPELPVAFGALQHAGQQPCVEDPADPPPPDPQPSPPPPAVPVEAPAPRRRWAVLALAAVVLAGALVPLGIWLSDEKRTEGADQQTGFGRLGLQYVHDMATVDVSALTVADDQTIFAYATGDGVNVSLLPPDYGEYGWLTHLDYRADALSLYHRGELLIVDIDQATDDEDQAHARVVLNPADGEILWQRSWRARDTQRVVAVRGTESITHGIATIVALSRVDPNGDDRWLQSIGADRVVAVPQPPDSQPADDGWAPLPDHPGTGVDAPTPPATTAVGLNHHTGDVVAVDLETGEPIGQSTIAVRSDKWLAVDDLLIGASADTDLPDESRLVAYTVPGFEPAWQQRIHPGPSGIEELTPCGRYLLCVKFVHAEGAELAAVDTRTGEQQWTLPAGTDDGDMCYGIDDHVVYDDGRTTRIVRRDGTTTRDLLPQGTAIRAAQGGRIALQVPDETTAGWRLRVEQVDTGRRTQEVHVGAEPPVHVALGDRSLAVVTTDFRVLLFEVTGL